MPTLKRNSLERVLIRAEDVSPYATHKGKKIFKLHINRRGHSWLGFARRTWRRVMDVFDKNLKGK